MLTDFQVVIVNPGTHPEPMHLALAFAQRGIRCIYFTSSSFKANGSLMRLSRTRIFRRTRFAKQIGRRALPVGFESIEVIRVATFWEILATTLRKFNYVLGKYATHLRTRRFAASVKRVLTQKNFSNVVLVCQQTAALKLFVSFPEAYKVLLYPLCHHRWLQTRMLQEQILNPDWAEFAQGADLSERQARRLDFEIDLADLVLVPSTFAKNTFENRITFDEKVKVTLLGAEVQPDLDIKNAQAEVRKESISLIFAGQCNQRKGISYLISAIEELKPLGIKLTIVGEANPKVREKISSFELDVTFKDSKPRSDLLREMASHDVLVLPSLGEGFGLVALEAMSVGTPAIVSDATFGKDVIHHGKNGWLVKSGDPSDLASTVALLHKCKPQEYLEISRKCQKDSRKYTWQAYGAKASEIILTASMNLNGVKPVKAEPGAR